jgi:hypothetical protein
LSTSAPPDEAASTRQVNATNRMLAAAGRMMAQLRSERGAAVGRLDAERAQRAALLRMLE